ncbi:hypothetical protein [Cellulomonas sp. Y8]|uniref:hypothetical protein n=1 Tax=Cellulomonas sp. Y8 TaxID=2591145 RepID=UPI003D75F9C6
MSTKNREAFCAEDGVQMINDVDCWRCPVCNRAQAKRARPALPAAPAVRVKG